MIIIQCSKCGSDVSNVAGTCSRCGADVEPQVRCTDCGQHFDSSLTSCPACGCPVAVSQPHTVSKETYNPRGALGQREDMESLVHPKEKMYFAITVVVSVLLYLSVFFIFGFFVGIGYLVSLAAFLLVGQGLFLGNLKGNAVQVSERQLPDIHQLTVGLSREMGLRQVPEVYIVQSGGVLNALASWFFGKDFVVIYSDVLELAYENGEPAVAFVLAHELAHVKRKHVILRLLFFPGMLMPFLGKAYSRACEYTCDRLGAHWRPDGAADGLRVLAAGKRLYTRVDIEEFRTQGIRDRGFWTWFAEILSTHPYLSNRLTALQEQGLLEQPTTSQTSMSEARQLSA